MAEEVDPEAEAYDGWLVHLWASLSANSGTWISGVLVVTFLVKLSAVSRGSTTTALVLLRHAGVAQVAAGVSLIAVPFLTLCLFCWLVNLEGSKNAERPFFDFPWFTFLVACVALALFFSFAAAFMALLACLATIGWRTLKSGWRRRGETPAEPPDAEADELPTPLPVAEPVPARFVEGAFVLLGLLLFGTLALDRRPWLPAEVVTTDQGSTYGYVVASEDGDLLLMEGESRTILRIHSSEVERRAFCSGPKPWVGLARNTSLIDVIDPSPEPDYPSCRSLTD